jgi:hypothetical protein
MTPSNEPPRRRFDDLLPYYVTGRLSAADREWTDQYLAAHPEARAALDWHRDLQAEVVEKAQARAMQAPEMVGWARVEATLRASRKAKPPSIAERLGAFLDRFAGRRWAPVAAVLILVQGVTIGTLVTRPAVDESQLTRSASTVAPRDVLQVRFKQSASEHELRALLYGAGARIVDGPDQLGDYVVEPRRGTLVALQTEFERSALVQGVTRLEAWKPEPRED